MPKGIGGAVRAFSTGSARAISARCRSWSGWSIIWTVFQSLNPIFLAPNNLVNLLFDCSTVGVIALGIVCILMVGEIDLSVGSVSGFASALVGVLWVNQGWPVSSPSWLRSLFGALIGALYARPVQPLRHAELRLDPGGPARLLGPAALPARLHRLDQPALRLAAGEFRPAARDAGPGCPTLLRLFPAIVMFVLGYRTAARRRAGGPVASSRWPACSLRAVVVTVGLEFDRLLPQPRSRRPVDVRPLRRPRRGDELRPHPHQMGPLDDGGRRQPRGRAPRGHQCAPHLHDRLRALLDVRGRSAAFSPPRVWPPPASRPAPATSTSTPSPRP